MGLLPRLEIKVFFKDCWLYKYYVDSSNRFIIKNVGFIIYIFFLSMPLSFFLNMVFGGLRSFELG